MSKLIRFHVRISDIACLHRFHHHHPQKRFPRYNLNLMPSHHTTISSTSQHSLPNNLALQIVFPFYEHLLCRRPGIPEVAQSRHHSKEANYPRIHALQPTCVVQAIVDSHGEPHTRDEQFTVPLPVLLLLFLDTPTFTSPSLFRIQLSLTEQPKEVTADPCEPEAT